MWLVGKKVVAYGCNGEEEMGSGRVWLCTVVMVEEPCKAACLHGIGK